MKIERGPGIRLSFDEGHIELEREIRFFLFLNAQLSRGLEQLNRITIGIFDLDLLAARTLLHRVPKMEAGFLQTVNERWKVDHAKHDPVPSAWFLLLTVRHWPRSRRLRAAEQNLRVAERDACERGKLLVFEREAEVRGVERD